MSDEETRVPECVTCGSSNRDDARFCAQCGGALALVCASCARELAADARFCDGCGTPVAGAAARAAAPPPPAKVSEGAVRKSVTVLFADLGGSTGFGERTDPETAREVMARYYDMLRDAVEGHGGTVAKFTGDGVMAVWGIPEIAEDDAARAVAAGAAMQQRFESFADEVEMRHGERLTFRIGINTGEVVIADTDADMVGDALNVAARLEKECAPGRVLVGEETWRLTRGTMAYESLGSVTVAGRVEAVGIHQLVVSDTNDVAAEEATPFVGRDREVARLRAVFDGARVTTSARFVTVLGSPGVGKTRLAREFTSNLGDDVTVLEARCDRAGEATFAPIVDLIRNAVELDGLDDRASREAIDSILGDSIDSDERRRIVDVVVGVLGTAPARSTEETFWALRRMVESVAGEGGLVLVIDDIQWAESLLLDLLEHLAEWVSGTAFVLAGLARPELRELRPGLTEVGARVAEVLALDGLDSAATEELASRLLGTERLPLEIVERLPASTDGNPLFVRELVRMLVDDHVIERAGDGWELAIDADAVEVPPTIQSLLAARVERLPANERTVLESASVIGSEFNLGALRELAEPSQRDSLLDVLERLRRKELVEPAGTYWGDEPVHRFHHVLIRDAAYRRLLKAKRADLHERVARWTDDAARALAGEHEAAIAHHYEQAHDYLRQLGPLDEHGHALGARAAELLVTAADRALGREDLAAAGGLATRAVALTGDDDARTEAALLVACEALLASGDVRSAAPLVKRLAALAGDDRRLGAWAACFDAQVIVLTDPDRLAEAETAVTGAAVALADLDDQAGLAKAHLVRAGILARLGQVGACEVELDMALGAARTVDDHRRVTAVLGAAPAAALWGPSPLARAGGRCLDVVRLLRITAASPSVEASSMRTQAVLEALRGRFDTARSMLERSRGPLEELGLQHGLLEADLFAGIIELIAGDPLGAEAPLRSAYGGLGALGVGADAGQAAALLAGSLLAQGRVDEADEMAAASEAMAGQNLKTGVAWRAARAQILSARGDHDRAVALAEDAVQIAEPTDLLLDHADACVVLAQVRDAAGDRAGGADAREHAGRLYRAKGATTLADRVADQKGVNEPQSARQLPSAPDNKATMTARQLVRQWMDGDLDAALDRYAENYEFVDRRQGLADRSSGREAMREQFEVILELLDGDQFEVFDVVEQRGERLTLFTQGVNGKIQLEMLSLMEFDTTGHATYACIYDMADLDAAITELDARYLAQGTPPRPAMNENLASQAARRTLEIWTSGDVDGVRDCFVEHTLLEDRRRGLQNRTTSLDEMIAQIRVVLELQDEHDGRRLEITEIVAERGDRLTIVRQGVDSDDVQIEMLCLSEVQADGRAVYNCMYDVDDLDQAIADLDARYRAQTGSDVHDRAAATGRTGPPPAENLATRAVEAYMPAWLAQDRDGVVAFFGEPFERIDRRSGPVGPEVTTSAAWWTDVLLSFPDVGFTRVVATPRCVRGDRLALVHLHLFSDDGAEYETLQYVETDADGLIIRLIGFDPDAFVEAYTELSERYASGEGATFADLIRINLAVVRARQEQDWDRMASLVAEDFVVVDHRPLKWGTGDIDTFLANEQSHFELMPDLLVVHRAEQYAGRATFLVADEGGTEPSGDAFLDTVVVVAVSTARQHDSRNLVERLELFEGDAYDDALARFHELAAASARTGPPPTENTATRGVVQGARAFEADDRGAMVALYNPTCQFVDRRSGPVGGPITSIDDRVDRMLSFREVGFVRHQATVWCVRGDRLALCHLHLATDNGDEYELLQLLETGDDGRAVRVVLFDGDALVDAFAELSERYATGEGAAFADFIWFEMELVRARQLRDWDRLATLFTDDFVQVDHRPLKWGTGGRDTYLSSEQSHAELMPDLLVVYRAVQYDGAASLLVADVHGTQPGGGEFGSTTFVAVSTVESTPSGLRFDRVELYDGDAYGDAQARFHELTALSRPTAGGDLLATDNLATKAFERSGPLWLRGDREGLASMYGRPFERRTQRAGPVGVQTTSSVGDWVEALLSFRDVGFDRFEVTPWCVRGERLALVHLRVGNEAGDEYEALQLLETDGDGLIVQVMDFDADAFADAYAELAEWYAAGEGADHADVIRVDAAICVARQKQDWESFSSGLAPDLVYVDHRPLRWGTGDRDTLLANEQSHFEVMPDLRVVYRAVRHVGDAGLSVADVIGTDPGGVLAKHTLLVVSTVQRVGSDLLCTRCEAFDEDDVEAALGRLHELAAEPVERPRSVPPRWARTLRFRDLMAAGWFDEAAELLDPEFTRVDRRRGIADAVADRAAYLDAWRALNEVGLQLETPEPVAWRGDGLSLFTTRYVTARGDEMAMLTLWADGSGGTVRDVVLYDTDDLAAAMRDLDDRYLAGEGAAHADFVRLNRNFQAAYLARDRSALEALLSDDLAFVDHRPLGWPAGGRGVFLTAVMGHVDQVHKLAYVHRSLEVEGNAFRLVIDVASRWNLVQHVAGLYDANRGFTRVEFFGSEGEVAAIARFHQLSHSGDDRPPTHPPDWDRVVRFRDLVAAGSFDEAGDLLDPEFTRVDRRRGVSDGVADRAAYMDAWRAMNDVGLRFAVPEPVAWRGKDLALLTVRFATAAGDELAMLSLNVAGPTGLTREMVLYDVDDLATALRDLDDRYLAGEGAEDADAIDLGLRDLEAYVDRDWPRRADLRTADFEFVDHRPLSWGRGDKHLLEANDRSFAESMADVQFVVRTFEVDGTFAFATLDLRGTTTAGVAFERTLFGLSAMTVVDGSLLISRTEYFDEDQYLDARARFDELTRPEQASPPERPPGRAEGFKAFRADIASGRIDEAKAFLHPDFVRIDRRRGSQTPPVDRDGYIASLAAASDVGLQLTSSTHLAERGDRLELVRVRFESPAGDEMVTLAVQEFDDAERAKAVVAFDDDDLADALRELEDRYATGEGAAHADVVRFVRDVFQARLARDVDRLATFYADDFTYVDHRQLGWATGDTDTYLADERTQIDLLPVLTVVPRMLQIDGDAVLITTDVHGVTTEGVDYDRVTVSVCQTRAVVGRRVFARAEYYDADQLPNARARFAELDRPAGMPESRAMRTIERLHRAWVARGRHGMLAELSPDFRRDERRRGPNAADADINSPEEYVDFTLAGVDVGLTDFVFEPRAVLGESLVLHDLTWRSAGGHELRWLWMVEVDDDAKICTVTNFDADALAAATDAVAHRYIELHSAEHTPVLDVSRRALERANARDRGAVEALLAPDVLWVDRSSMPLPERRGRVQVAAAMWSLYELSPTTVDWIAAVHAVAPHGSVVTVNTAARTADGDLLEWSHQIVTIVADGQITRIEQYDEADRGAAVTRLAELAP